MLSVSDFKILLVVVDDHEVNKEFNQLKQLIHTNYN